MSKDSSFIFTLLATVGLVGLAITLFIKEGKAPPPVEIGHQYKYGDIIEFKDNFYGNCKGNVYAVGDIFSCTVYNLKANCDSGVKDMKFKYYAHRYTNRNCSANGLFEMIEMIE